MEVFCNITVTFDPKKYVFLFFIQFGWMKNNTLFPFNLFCVPAFQLHLWHEVVEAKHL